ncbi:hypothetical protein BT93_A0117 [Corymbia citriodora subsp. variegata]|nr:hypothetical protein BT93_A0117 [Corymbia citriodora subsp. variegata]
MILGSGSPTSTSSTYSESASSCLHALSTCPTLMSSTLAASPIFLILSSSDSGSGFRSASFTSLPPPDPRSPPRRRPPSRSRSCSKPCRSAADPQRGSSASSRREERAALDGRHRGRGLGQRPPELAAAGGEEEEAAALGDAADGGHRRHSDQCSKCRRLSPSIDCETEIEYEEAVILLSSEDSKGTALRKL